MPLLGFFVHILCNSVVLKMWFIGQCQSKENWLVALFPAVIQDTQAVNTFKQERTSLAASGQCYIKGSEKTRASLQDQSCQLEKNFLGSRRKKRTGGGSMYRAPKIRAPGKHLESEKEEEQTAKQHMQKERINVTSNEALGNISMYKDKNIFLC